VLSQGSKYSSLEICFRKGDYASAYRMIDAYGIFIQQRYNKDHKSKKLKPPFNTYKPATPTNQTMSKIMPIEPYTLNT
jgi:hypothetical protein